ncbi:MAG: ABC transporter ATP-binding protein/permease [Lachnospiraceae bacterium]|nr:ABC transporter ATP-binding protein/permease [Lachnospiraceae bacterium]
MKLNYDLTDSQLQALELADGESVWYCVPVDLVFDNKTKKAREAFTDQIRLIVTEKRLIVLDRQTVLSAFSLADCVKIKCEHQVHSGILTITGKDGQMTCAARFSMKHIVRVSYVARGAQTIIDTLYAPPRTEAQTMIPPRANAQSHVKTCTQAQTSAQAGVQDQTSVHTETQTQQSETRTAVPPRIVSREYEHYCEKCGRALPGTRTCPYCDGKATMILKFFSLCSEFKGTFILICVLMLFSSLASLITPIVQQRFIDNALSTGDGTWRDLGVFAAATLSLLLVSIIFNVLRYWHCVRLGASISMTLRQKLYYKIQALSLSFLNKRQPGVLMNRISRDTRQIRQFMEEVFCDMFSALLTMVFSLAMMLYLNWKMTLLTFVFVAIAFILARVFWRRIHTIYHKQWVKSDELNSNLQDVLSGMRVVKSFGQEQREADRFTRKTKEFAAISVKNETFWAIFRPIITFLVGFGTYIAVLFGGLDVLEGDMMLGQLVQYITYCGYLTGPLTWMTNLPRQIMQLITSLNRIYDVLDEEEDLTNAENAKEFQLQGGFRFEHVSFGYDSYEPVLEDLNFEVKPGEMIGLVGASGTGKSTLINLIMRLYDVDQGRILLDGVDIKEINTECLHSQIGVVLQETFLFSGSILANIRFARQDASLQEVIAAAKAANAHDFICKTPDGYNTYVGEHGYNLSGGERQRISIARAILNNPRLLILDEATSALDTESEFLIQQALNRLVQGRTTFAIAHRLSTLRSADRLIVIDKHGIAEIGTHNELLEKKGIYYGLVTAQLKMAEGK